MTSEQREKNGKERAGVHRQRGRKGGKVKQPQLLLLDGAGMNEMDTLGLS